MRSVRLSFPLPSLSLLSCPLLGVGEREGGSKLVLVLIAAQKRPRCGGTSPTLFVCPLVRALFPSCENTGADLPLLSLPPCSYPSPCFCSYSGLRSPSLSCSRPPPPRPVVGGYFWVQRVEGEHEAHKKHLEEEAGGHLPEKPRYEYLNIRKKAFPWGNNSLFFNPHVRPVPVFFRFTLYFGSKR
ncbi:hypothetical protein CALVIDRAFT_139650 [Calocera viscosa TUFC12733]|uniref:Uncharacterized protein n=1 Tax=Calocera viscosa (strain TUFC12733) TaxID=1330018 RepID=A0A167M182_CALVF|nr:hypothetical protein CALVIDRAFT_139650 [Calocera viscosa TUFC12733]